MRPRPVLTASLQSAILSDAHPLIQVEKSLTAYFPQQDFSSQFPVPHYACQIQVEISLISYFRLRDSVFHTPTERYVFQVQEQSSVFADFRFQVGVATVPVLR